MRKIDDKEIKICEVCGKSYIKNSNYQKYCKDCSEPERRRRSAIWHRENKNKKVKPREKVYTKLCKSCIYSMKLDGMTVCNYLEIMGHMRECEAKDCIKYVHGTQKDRNRLLRKRMDRKEIIF